MSARTASRRPAALAVLGVALFALAACGNGTPAATSSPSPSTSASASPSTAPTTPAPGPSTSAPTSPPQAGADIQLPAACEGIYSAGMLSTLESGNPPLNDPGIAMFSTGIEAVYDVLVSGIPTLRCTWGVPSEIGLATNVSIIDAAQRESLEEILVANGLTCSDYEDGRMCRILIEYPEDEFSPGHTAGETHYLRGNGWVSTSWINFGPEGYTEDIVATLWS